MGDMPVWVVFVATFILVMVSIEAGYRLGQRAHRKSKDEKESPVSAIAATVLGLLAFMLAFTFGIASDRFDAKKELVRDEANAIRTAWLRADFLPERDRVETRGLLWKYLDVRLAVIQSGRMNLESVRRFIPEAERIQHRLWGMAVENARKDMNSDVAALYIESLNEMFGIQALRVAIALQARIPAGIWLALYCVMILGMMAVGYQTGIAGSKRSMARPILAFSFTLVIAMIASLDRPDSGFIGVTQQPLMDVKSWMAAGPNGTSEE